MKSLNRYLLAFACLAAAFLACKNDDEPAPPEVVVDEALTVGNQGLVNAGMVRVEDFIVRDFASETPTHVNYGLVMTSEQLVQVTYGDKNFWEIDQDNLSDYVTGVVFNVYAPIQVQGGTVSDNLLGGAAERTFTMAADPVSQSEGDYLYSEASFSILDSNDFNNTRAYFATEGTIKIKGTFPNLEVTLDLLLEDDVRLLTASLKGTISLTFQVIENR